MAPQNSPRGEGTKYNICFVKEEKIEEQKVWDPKSKSYYNSDSVVEMTSCIKIPVPVDKDSVDLYFFRYVPFCAAIGDDYDYEGWDDNYKIRSAKIIIDITNYNTGMGNLTYKEDISINEIPDHLLFVKAYELVFKDNTCEGLLPKDVTMTHKNFVDKVIKKFETDKQTKEYKDMKKEFDPQKVKSAIDSYKKLGDDLLILQDINNDPEVTREQAKKVHERIIDEFKINMSSNKFCRILRDWGYSPEFVERRRV